MKGRALLVGAVLVGAAVAASSDATASAPALSITSTPTIQKLETKIVNRNHHFTLRFGTATFTVVVANPGDLDLDAVSVVDPASPSCNRTIGTLAAGASVSYVCRAPNIGRNFTNRLTVSGNTQDGIRTLATTTAAVTVQRPIRKHSHIHIALAFTG